MTTLFIPCTNVNADLLDAAISSFFAWDGTIASIETDSDNGCFAACVINGITYVSSELYGDLNSVDNAECVALLIAAATSFVSPAEMIALYY